MDGHSLCNVVGNILLVLIHENGYCFVACELLARIVESCDTERFYEGEQWVGQRLDESVTTATRWVFKIQSEAKGTAKTKYWGRIKKCGNIARAERMKVITASGSRVT